MAAAVFALVRPPSLESLDAAVVAGSARCGVPARREIEIDLDTVGFRR